MDDSTRSEPRRANRPRSQDRRSGLRSAQLGRRGDRRIAARADPVNCAGVTHVEIPADEPPPQSLESSTEPPQVSTRALRATHLPRRLLARFSTSHGTTPGLRLEAKGVPSSTGLRVKLLRDGPSPALFSDRDPGNLLASAALRDVRSAPYGHLDGDGRALAARNRDLLPFYEVADHESVESLPHEIFRGRRFTPEQDRGFSGWRNRQRRYEEEGTVSAGNGRSSS